MKVAIIDDEEQIGLQISDCIQRFSAEHGILMDTSRYTSGSAFLKCYKKCYDIIILDVDMPQLNGIETAKEIRKHDQDVTIMFITNIAQYAINGYEVDAVSYMLKPVLYQDFAMTFYRVVSKAMQRTERFIPIETSDGLQTIRVSDLVYVEVLSHYLFFHTTDSTYKVRGTITEFLGKIKAYYFAQCHRSYLVNLRFVKQISKNEVTANSIKLPISRSYKESFVEQYMKYVHGEF